MTKIHFLSGPRIIIIIQVLRRLVSRLVLLEKKEYEYICTMDIEVKLRTQLGVFIGAIGLKNKPKEMAKYIRKNREFFPKIKEEHIVELETSE